MSEPSVSNTPTPQDQLHDVEEYYINLLPRIDEVTPDLPDTLTPYKQWYQAVMDVMIKNADQSRTFIQELINHQLQTVFSQILSIDAPSPLVIDALETPTQVAYNARKRQLVKENRYREPITVSDKAPASKEDEQPVEQSESSSPPSSSSSSNDDDSRPQLPDDDYVGEFPAMDGLSAEDKQLLIDTVTKWKEAWDGSKIIEFLTEDLRRTRALLKELASEESWELIRSSHGINTYYRREDGLPNHSFKVSGIVDAEAIELFTVIYEVSLFHLWFPFMKDVKEIHAISRYAKIVQSTISAPWPMYNRELILDCSGVDDTARGRVLINIRSLPRDSPHYFSTPGTVHCEMHLGGFLLEPVTPTTTKISFYSNVDPDIAILPTSLLNMVTGKLIHTMLPTMAQTAPKTRGEDSPWAPMIKHHQRIYDDVRRIISSFYIDENGNPLIEGADAEPSSSKSKSGKDAISREESTKS